MEFLIVCLMALFVATIVFIWFQFFDKGEKAEKG